MTVLGTVTAVTREAADSLLCDRGDYRAGSKVDMIEMMFAAARLHNELHQLRRVGAGSRAVRAQNRPQRRGWLSRWRRTEAPVEATHEVPGRLLADAEHEVAELRRVLAEAAGS